MDILMDTMARWEDPALPRQYAAMQILVKHKGSKMTQSNRDPTGEAAAAAASLEDTLLFLKIAPILIRASCAAAAAVGGHRGRHPCERAGGC